ncbi:MAG: hypothetical protein WD065_16825 [Planctomycetaceae bacterium]
MAIPKEFIRCVCDSCQARFRVQKSSTSRKMKCKNCGHIITIPAVAEATNVAQSTDPSVSNDTLLSESGSCKMLSHEWERTLDGLDSLYLYGAISGFVLIAWLTIFVVLFFLLMAAAGVAQRMLSPHAGNMMAFMLMAISSFTVLRKGWESDEDLRFHVAFLALGWLYFMTSLLSPFLGAVILLGVLGGGIAVIIASLCRGMMGIVNCLEIPENTRAKPWIRATLALFGLALAMFAAAIILAMFHFREILRLADIRGLESLLIGGIALLTIANVMFALFLRIIPAVFRDNMTASYINNYVVYACFFLIITLFIAYLLLNGSLESNFRVLKNTGPNIARIVYVVFAGVNLYWLLRCIDAARNDIRPYSRDPQ